MYLKKVITQIYDFWELENEQCKVYLLSKKFDIDFNTEAGIVTKLKKVEPETCMEEGMEEGEKAKTA